VFISRVSPVIHATGFFQPIPCSAAGPSWHFAVLSGRGIVRRNVRAGRTAQGEPAGHSSDANPSMPGDGMKKDAEVPGITLTRFHASAHRAQQR